MLERPGLLRWFRAWCVLMVGIYSGFIVAGGALALHCLEEPALGAGAAAVLGGAPALGGLIGAGIHGALAFLPQRDWAWKVGLAGLVLGTVSTCPPLALPLLLGWLRPEVRAWFAENEPE